MFEARFHAARHLRLFALFGAGSVIAAAAWACGSSSTSELPATGDGGDDLDSGSLTAICPTSVPDAGTTCSAPEGTTCAFGVCDGIYAVCTGGVWRSAPVTPVPSGCPEGIPSAGSACPTCFSSDASCPYVLACADDASAVRASCVSRVWQLVDEACPNDAGTDSGTTSDASVDASADADGGG